MKGHVKLQEKLDEYSMLKDVPQMKSESVDRDLNNLGELKYDPAFNLIVKHDIDKMHETVQDEMKITLGMERPHRKVQPTKEAVVRMNKVSKTSKHEISEQIARENMKMQFFDKTDKVGAHPKGKLNAIVENNYQKGL